MDLFKTCTDNFIGTLCFHLKKAKGYFSEVKFFVMLKLKLYLTSKVLISLNKPCVVPLISSPRTARVRMTCTKQGRGP